jgi:hypothetical protein
LLETKYPLDLDKKLKANDEVANIINQSNKCVANNSDATDLSSTKSAQRIYNIDRSNFMKVKLSNASSEKEDFKVKFQKKPSGELIFKTNSDMKSNKLDVPDLGTDLF